MTPTGFAEPPPSPPLKSIHLSPKWYSFFPEKKFLKMPIPHFKHKKSCSRPIYMVSKFAEHLQHFSDIDKFLKQICILYLNFLKLMLSS